MRMGDYGITTIVYTDITRDGTLQGVKAESFANIAIRSGISVIASGGVGSIDDIKATNKIKQYLSDHGITLMDHILVCGDKTVSMSEIKKYSF